MSQPTKLFDGNVIDVDPKRLKPAPYNPRVNMKTANPAAFARVKKSLEKGVFKPILVNKRTGYIVGGHQRVEAAIDLGWATVPVLYLDVSEAEEKRINIADNADWEGQFVVPLLQDMVVELREEKVDLDLLGFSDKYLCDLVLDAGGDTRRDDDFDVDAEAGKIDIPTTQPGDLYILGRHRLLCGDSTKAEDVDYLMAGEKADMVFTDPPYNTGMTSKENGQRSGSTWLTHFFDDSYTDDEWEKFMAAFVEQHARVLKADSVAYVCLDWRRNHELIPHLKRHFQLSNVIVWDKVVHGLGSDYKYTYELINVCKKGKPSLDTHQGDREYMDVWHIQRKIGRDDDHATKKPIELPGRAMRHASHAGGLVVDLFCGSGSTLVAAELAGRRCFTMELMPQYCDVAVKRWEQLTGKRAKRVAAKTKKAA